MIEQVIKGEKSHQTFVEGISSLMLSAVDEELIREFIQLDLQCMTFIASRATGGRVIKNCLALVELPIC